MVEEDDRPRFQCRPREIGPHLPAVTQNVRQSLRPSDQIPAAIRTHGRADHAEDRHAVAQQRHGNRRAAKSLQPGPRAVVRVHQPAERRAVARSDRGFLADESGRQEGCQSAGKILLDLGIDRGLVARAARSRRAARLLDQHRGRPGGRTDHHRQDRSIERHFSSLDEAVVGEVFTGG